ncbi:MAG: hypothetical protein WCI94_20300 [Rhodospirillales bacterium]
MDVTTLFGLSARTAEDQHLLSDGRPVERAEFRDRFARVSFTKFPMSVLKPC